MVWCGFRPFQASHFLIRLAKTSHHTSILRSRVRYGVQGAIWLILGWYIFQDIIANLYFTINNHDNMIVCLKNIYNMFDKKSNTNIYKTKRKKKKNMTNCLLTKSSINIYRTKKIILNFRTFDFISNQNKAIVRQF